MTGVRTAPTRTEVSGDISETLADALEVVGSALRAGLTPAAALALVESTTLWGAREAHRVREVRRRMQLGLPTREAWCRPRDPGAHADAYRTVASVWDLALQTGGPLADAVDGVCGHLREEARLRARLEGLAAGPRTSRRLLSVLPIAGPALAVLIGADLVDLYSTVVGSLSVLVGVGLTGIGWWWSRDMVERATRPRPYPTGTVRSGRTDAAPGVPLPGLARRIMRS